VGTCRILCGNLLCVYFVAFGMKVGEHTPSRFHKVVPDILDQFLSSQANAVHF